jgi:hypothetical protein
LRMPLKHDLISYYDIVCQCPCVCGPSTEGEKNRPPV